jgi:predicted MPP superfamily phosphohydrolase
LAFTEKVSILLFLAVIVGILVAEAGILLRSAANALLRRPVTRILFSKFAIFIHLLACILAICFLYGYFVEPYWIEVKTIKINTSKLKAASFRIVQISDMHCETKPRNEEKLVRIINALEPDVIIFTGDTLNTPEALGRFRGTMKSLKAGLAKVAVRGNFDVWFWHDLNLYGDTGFKVLDKDSINIEKAGEKITISGLNFEYAQSLRGVLSSIPSDRFNIFACHYSDFAESLSGLNVDLYLCGHTHGGQVALPGYGAIITLSKFGKKYEAGQYRIGSTTLYVNRGIGMEAGHAPRVRFLARPEITVFEVRGSL